jgi:hypothetical protein
VKNCEAVQSWRALSVVKERIVGAYGMKILTNIRVHIRDWMPEI